MSDESKNTGNSIFPPFVRPYYTPHLVINDAKAVRVTDDKGRTFLDCYAGVATVALGHCNEAVDDAAKAQIDSFGHISALYESQIQKDYGKKLIKACNSSLSQVFFVNSGSEAVDLAISLARVAAKAPHVVALKEGYHGGTYLSKTATGLDTWHFACEDAPHFSYVSSPLDKESASQSLVEIEKEFSAIYMSGGRPIFIMEPIMGVGGIVVPPPFFFSGLKVLLKKYHAFLLLDEVQSGMGRCGDTVFAFQKFDLNPDLLMLGKGIANGYPLGATLMTNEIAEANNDLLHFNTFGGHPVSVAAANATLDIVNKAEFLKEITVKGEKFRGRLHSELKDCPKVIAVRGMGYMTGVEVDSAETAASALTVLYDEGLLIGMGGRGKNVLRLQPALIFSDENYGKVVELLAKVLHSIK